MNVLLDDDISQQALSKYCEVTEGLLRNALLTLDKTADCNLHCSIDLGFPHDLIRIAGGFATGSFVDWSCSVPFIPVDTTINVCTGSVFEISGFDPQLYSQTSFERFRQKFELSTYNFNFQRGNHFIIIARSELSEKFYLLLHSSASEFKKGYNGLYPVQGNWFYNDIKTITKDDRYIRFISGNKAELFSRISKNIEGYNELRHEFAATTFLGEETRVISVQHWHHYFMPDQSSVMLGSYLAEEFETVPIFTSLGMPIFMFNVQDNINNRINFRGTTRYLVPHGWGKKSVCKPLIEVDLVNKAFALNNRKQKLDIESSLRDHPDLSTRIFSCEASDPDYYFSRINRQVSGVVVDKLVQLISYTKHGYSKWL